MFKRFFLISLIILIFATVLIADPPSWQQIAGTEYNMVLMSEVNFNNQPFIGTGENMVAAFGPGGESDCRAIAIWDPNQIWYFTIIGITNGEEIRFKIYDESTDSIHESLNSIEFQNNSTIGSGSNPFEILMPSITILNAPEDVTISINPFSPTLIVVDITWSAVTNAYKYYIYSDSKPNVDTTGQPFAWVVHPQTSWSGIISLVEDKRFYVVIASDEEADNFK